MRFGNIAGYKHILNYWFPNHQQYEPDFYD